MEGQTSLILLDEESILVWIAEMVKHAHSFKCRLGDWGAFLDLRNVPPFELGTSSASDWFKRGVAASEACCMTEAFGYFRAATLEDLEFADGFDGMGTVQFDLWLVSAALKNYEQAVQLAPEDVSLRLNRGAARDYLGDRQGALADYDYIIARLPHCSQAFLNRGNTKYGAHDIEGACEDWKHAKELGCDTADSYLHRFCSVLNRN
jgi:tetratricopeptide (TPR) repeat protein